MAKSAFDAKFNLKFHQHKSLIPIGIEDDDYKTLATVYGTPYDEIMLYVKEFEESNKKYAEKLEEKIDLSVFNDKQLKIAFLGDSITSDRQSFMNIIKKALSDKKGIDIRDFAISGQTSDNLLIGFNPEVRAFHADVAHILIGTNDMRKINDRKQLYFLGPAEYEKNLDYVVGELVQEGTKVIISTIPPFSLTKVEKSLPEYLILYKEEDRALYNNIIEKIAGRYSVELNNMDPFFSNYDSEDLTLPDGIHLNSLGHELMTIAVTEKIIKAIG